MVARSALARRSRIMWPAPTVVVERGPGRARVRHDGLRNDDRSACVAQQRRILRAVERGGGRRATLLELSCISRGASACEYAVTWKEPVPVAPAVTLLVLAVAPSALLLSEAVPLALSLPISVSAVAAFGLYAYRLERANRRAHHTAVAAFRHLVARAAALRHDRSQELVLPSREPDLPGRGALPTLIKDGDFWRLEHGSTSLLLRHSRGLALLGQLVHCPGISIHVRDLDSATPSGGTSVAHEAPAPGRDAIVFGDAGEVLDVRARTEYRQRIAELRAELEDAERCHDLGRVETARTELAVLAEQLETATGANGRPRRVSSDAERLRVSITRRIRTAIAQIGKHDAELGAHFDAHVATGYSCVYDPHSPCAAGSDSPRRSR